MPWPRIVAESLRQVDRAAMLPPLGVSPATALAVIQAATVPVRSDAVPPSFLLPTQVDSWRRTMAALRAWRGALLAEPVGTGKTWIALGVCAAESSRATVLVPAILRDQWRRAAERAGVGIDVWTHERASRGAVPPGNPGLVVIDEAHRFRNLSTRRAQAIGPWLIGRRVLLLSGTPIVNRLADLISVLQLALTDDALALDGVASLNHLADLATPPVALSRVVIRGAALPASAYTRQHIGLPCDGAEEDRGKAAVNHIKGFALSTTPAIRRLIATVLLDAAGSSDAALGDALRRYRALLLQARDAGGASRAMLRRFAGDSLEQLVMWPLLQTDAPANELPLDDIARVNATLTQVGHDDAWIARMLTTCADETVTVCYTRHRSTARKLRDTCGDNTAWVTGSDAGIGPHRMARDAVLAAFGLSRPDWQGRRVAPRLLVATDVASEGLDLQGAGRIIHVDLPWTAVRVDQREGRLLRLGQQHEHVEVITRHPPTAIEAALALRAGVHRKHVLAHRWIAALDRPGPIADIMPRSVAIACMVDGQPAAMLVTVALRAGDRTGVISLTRNDDGTWQPDGDQLDAIVRRIAGATPCMRALPPVASDLAAAVRTALAHVGAGRFDPPPGLVTRIHQAARIAARMRNGNRLVRLDRLLRFVTASPSAGSRMLLGTVASMSDAELRHWRAPEVAAPAMVEAHAIAAVVMIPAEAPAVLFPSSASGLR
jgi:hypothetical protein